MSDLPNLTDDYMRQKGADAERDRMIETIREERTISAQLSMTSPEFKRGFLAALAVMENGLAHNVHRRKPA